MYVCMYEFMVSAIRGDIAANLACMCQMCCPHFEDPDLDFLTAQGLDLWLFKAHMKGDLQDMLIQAPHYETVVLADKDFNRARHEMPS